MKKVLKKSLAFLLAIAMVSATLLQAAPVQAAPIVETMAHLVAGPGNGNGHFQSDADSSNPPEAFVLSKEATYKNEAFSFTMKFDGIAGQSRFRFVNKYVDDANWSYIGFDCTEWKSQQMVNGAEAWSDAGVYAALPSVSDGDVVKVSGKYTDAGLELTVINVTQETSGTVTITDGSFNSLANVAGKVGFGGGYRPASGQTTNVYLGETVVGDAALGFTDFEVYSKSVGTEMVWEQAEVTLGDDGIDEEEVEARKWFVLQGGSNNAGGHNYGSGSGPLFYTDTDKTMVSGGTISMAIKPSNNWGVFYSYHNDSNWLYVGYDSHSKWYYQYRWNGQESYPQISGLPDPVEGEELALTISLSNETLAVTVNGTTSYTTNQVLKDMANSFTSSYGNLGKFGVMTKGQTKISFADFSYDGENCMNDAWAFNFERPGQTMTEEVTAMEPVTGTVTDADGKPVGGVTVRVGTKSATTKVDGTYRISNVQVGEYAISASKPGYEAYSGTITVEQDKDNVADIVIQKKADISLDDYAKITSDDMTVYLGNDFPVVVRYVMSNGEFFRGNEEALNAVVINGTSIVPTVEVERTSPDAMIYKLKVVNAAKSLDFTMDVKVSVEANTLTWEVTELKKADGCARIATIDIPHLNLLTVDASETDAVFAGAQASTTTTAKADTYITFDNGFVPSNEDGYLYAFLTKGNLSAGLHSNSEKEGDKRVERINGADTISLTSAVWYYEAGDDTLRNAAGNRYAVDYTYQPSELPIAKVAIANGDLNGDKEVDWNDGAIAFRDVMHYAYGTEVIKDTVNYRIVMNFESAAPNPFLMTADNVKKVYLATDGLPQALLLKGYGNEGHDSANSEYADIAEREGGVDDFQTLIEIAHDYNTEVGIHVNAQEAYPEARSFNETMVSQKSGVLMGNGWGWLDQSVVINKYWDLSSDARLKRFVQLYDRINETDFLSLDWEKKEYVKDSQGILTNGDGKTEVSREEAMALVKADAATREHNMDFIYLDVWYQDAWETRRIAEEINSMGWRFSTEFSGEGEYDSTWQHWSTDTTYGGAGAKGLNSDIIRFLRNDQRDSQVLNWPAFGGTADNPLLGGFRLYGFEGWGGQQNFYDYIHGTFTENLPTKFLQQYEVIDWENYEKGESPVGNTEKQITLTNGEDVVVVTRNEEQRSDIEIERTITVNGKVVLNTDKDEHTYLLPWIDNQTGEEKLYHWNLDGGTTTWELQEDWAALENVVVYELSDQGRINEETVAVENGSVTLEAKAAVAYVVVKGAEAKELVADFGEGENVVDPGFNGYADGAKLDAADWSGDINADGVNVVISKLGDQRLEMTNTNEDVEVVTTLSGLTAGEDYVAEIYVANESDARATMTVVNGKEELSVYTDRSIAQNYISCDNEHGTKMNRMQVSFVAEGETAELVLAREAGEGYTHWDDIRIVEQKLDNYKADGSFEQDFESVVQGLYPFVLGYNAGGDSRTHLSQLNAPYTQKGWNGKAVDDVLGGEWSLKHHTNITGLAYRTIPQNFRFEPGKVYNVEFDYQTVSEGYQMIVGEGTSYTRPTTYLPTTSTTQHASMQVIGSGSGQTWIGLFMNGSLCYNDTAVGTVDFILDNLKITEVKDAKAVTISATDLYLGETAEIYGSSLDEITWTTSKDGVVAVDKAAGTIAAIGAGEVTLTATFATGEVTEFAIVVTDSIAKNIDRAEFADSISIAANTEEAGGEGAVNGYATAAIDGDGSTFWHTAWSTGSFTVSQNNPAILTVDLGKEMEIGGFRFQQRNGSNGIVSQYSFKLKDAAGNVVGSGEHLKTSAGSGEWVSQTADVTGKAQYIEFIIEAGSNGFGCLAEIEPIAVEKVATKAAAADATVIAGEKVALNVTPANGGFLAGLKFTSSDESIAKVDKNGNVKGIKAGTVTITVSNALGVLDTCTVTVTGEAGTENVVEVFPDVKDGAWYVPGVQFVYDNGLMSGSNGLFNPTSDITRAQIVTTLYRLAGEPEVTDTKALTDFTDVAEGKYYTDAVCWAYANGVATGNDGKFDPTGELTRQQMAAFFFRYADIMGMDTTVRGDYSSMVNADKVSGYAEDAMAWAVGTGLISGSNVTVNGVAAKDLNPRGNTTRAQVATILMRFCEN